MLGYFSPTQGRVFGGGGRYPFPNNLEKKLLFSPCPDMKKVPKLPVAEFERIPKAAET